MHTSNLIAYILQMAWCSVFNCTYSGTKLVNSYPPSKQPCHSKIIVSDEYLCCQYIDSLCWWACSLKHIKYIQHGCQ